MSLKTLVDDFLSQKRIAVAGVSRNDGTPNLIYRRLREKGYTVFPVNPGADTVEGDTCYHDLKSIPGGVDGVVIVTRPEAVQSIVEECHEVGIKRVWMHKSFAAGSVSDSAVEYCRKNGIEVIAGACPMMYLEPVDFGHKCMRWTLGVIGGLPKTG